MTEPRNGAPVPADAPPDRIIITFVGPGQAGLTIITEGEVNIAQAGAAAWSLERWAQDVRIASMARQAGPGLYLPGLGGLPEPGRRPQG